MIKADFVALIQKKAKLPTKTSADATLSAFTSVLAAALAKGDSVTLTGFGTFKVMKRAARKGRNPRTGKEIKIPARKVAKFTAGKNLKETVNKK